MTNHRENTNKQKGFTLLEALVVITLIGIVSAISYPSISSFSRKSNFRAAARELLGAAMQARSNSIRDNANWRVTLDGADPVHKFLLVDPAGSDTRTHDLTGYGPTIRLIASGAGKTCGSAAGLTQETSVGFSGRGFGSPSGSIYLDNSNNDVCFEANVTTSGVARLRYYNGTTWN